jgi:hypothetical protein
MTPCPGGLLRPPLTSAANASLRIRVGRFARTVERGADWDELLNVNRLQFVIQL